MRYHSTKKCERWFTLNFHSNKNRGLLWEWEKWGKYQKVKQAIQFRYH